MKNNDVTKQGKQTPIIRKRQEKDVTPYLAIETIGLHLQPICFLRKTTSVYYVTERNEFIGSKQQS